MRKKTTLLDKIRRVTTDHVDVRSWRASLAGVLQVLMLLPFLLLVPYALSLIPSSSDRPLGTLIGTWAYSAVDEIRGASGIQLTLDSRGHFDMQALGRNEAKLRLRGSYTIDHGRLILRSGGKRMIWDARREGRDLVLTSVRGASIRFAPRGDAGQLSAFRRATASLD